MPLRRVGRLSPVFMVDRQIMLNESLSPTARLVYALLLAATDTEMKPPQVASLAGLDSTGALKPFLDELQAVGAVDVKEHAGESGQIVTVHESPLLPEQRSHPCVPCADCGKCSCEYTKGLCRDCSHIRAERHRAAEDIARWKKQLDEGKTYAVGCNGSRLHRWNCTSLNSVERGLEAMENAIERTKDGGPSYVYWPQLPTLYSVEELRQRGTKRRNCGRCGPDPF
ncbi:hypothetical protein AB0A60_32485 [Streptomyces sp. NPDC046275]|uniref:hypothetical protein n=1 Tax=Streptomyces sp. NPDC046275 TaxID=3157201 RepID=UPI0033FC0F7E